MGFKIRILFKAITAALIVGVLTGCPTGPRAPAPPATTAVPPQPTGPLVPPRHEGQPYDVVSADSLLTILAFRGGTLAKAGHNHVIASHDVTGTVYVPSDVMRSTFELHVPVAQLTIDEPQLRSKEGPDFPTEVPDSAKEGTRRNMLGDALLNGATYPEITLVSQRIEPAPAGASAHGSADGTPTLVDVQVIVRGQTHLLHVPVVYSLQNGQLTASGELPVKQSDLGLTPFSALLGALQVLDEMRIKFRIVARQAQVRGAGT